MTVAGTTKQAATGDLLSKNSNHPPAAVASAKEAAQEEGHMSNRRVGWAVSGHDSYFK